MIGFEDRHYSDEDIKQMKAITSSPFMMKHIERDCKLLLNDLEKDKQHYKDGVFLRKMLDMYLQRYPFFDTYMHATLREANKRGYDFGNEDEKLV